MFEKLFRRAKKLSKLPYPELLLLARGLDISLRQWVNGRYIDYETEQRPSSLAWLIANAERLTIATPDAAGHDLLDGPGAVGRQTSGGSA